MDLDMLRQQTEWTDAVDRLRRAGLEAPDETIVTYSDIAFAFGMSISDVAAIVSTASTGDYECLRVFGVRQENTDGVLSLTYRTCKSADMSPEGIQDFVSATVGAVHKGSTEQYMRTYSGAVFMLALRIKRLFSCAVGAANVKG